MYFSTFSSSPSPSRGNAYREVYSYAGIATHYIHSSSLPDVEQRLSELTFDDDATDKEKCSIVNSTIEEFVTGLPDEPILLAGTRREAIDR